MTACVLVAAAACGRSTATSPALAHGSVPSAGRSTYTLTQMNLCLSGIADCYTQVAYPAAIREAVAVIREARPDAVTISEACRGDAARISRKTGYHLRFSTVDYRGKHFQCVRPRGRGEFGNAVLTRAVIVNADDHAFATQAGIEQRRWLCVSTRARVEVCTAHLNTRSSVERAGNDGQCAELAAVLGRRPARTIIFGGDVNRTTSCAPAGFWTRTDGAAPHEPGLQQVYGSRDLRRPSAAVVPFAHSDHDVLLVGTIIDR